MFLFALFLTGCAGAPKEEHDAGPTYDCVDEDGDGYGAGADCLGTDCNDANRNAWREADCATGCATGAHDPGCACEAADFPDPEPCYTGPADTQNLGRCVDGLRTCAGEWSACDGQVTPTTEICNYVDDDCDGETDEAVKSACGCGLGVGVECAEAFETDGDDVRVQIDADGALVLADGETDGVFARHFEEPCTAKANDPAWTTMDWELETPAGTSIEIEARRENCGGGDPGIYSWIPIATVPDAVPPADVRQTFIDAGEPIPVTCLGVRLSLQSDTVGVTPRVVSIAANLTCR